MSASFVLDIFRRRWLSLALLALLLICLAPGAGVWLAAQPAPAAVWPLPAGTALPSSLRVVAQGLIPMPADTPAAHASALLAMPPGSPASVLAFWFAGSRESGPDVQIAFAYFDRAQQRWSPARFVLNRNALGAQLGFGVRRLGNPVAWLDAQGHVHLFVVATGLGGWAAGRIVHLRQRADTPTPDTLAFEPLRVLPLSWWWNTSHLVRAAPLPLADGGMVLPAYFEIGRKYPVAVHFGPQGEFLGLQRMGQQADALQPTLLQRSSTDWLALMRDNSAGRRVKAAQTQDAGAHWHDLPDLALPNPDASVAGLSLGPTQHWLAHNDGPAGRTELTLSRSANGLDWTPVLTLAKGPEKSEYSYPAMTWADGSLWVSYTDQRHAIAWQRLAPGANSAGGAR